MKQCRMQFGSVLFRRPPEAFTLIELLVVVTVISALTAILLPALASAKEQAKRVVCASNIRQLCLANTCYTQDNDGFYVIAAEDMWGRNLHRWHGTRSTVNSVFDPLKGPLREYVVGGKLKKCPSFVKYLETAGQNGQGFESGCGGYGYNDEYIGGRSDMYGMGEGSKHSARDVDVHNPTSTMMFTDCAFRQGSSTDNGIFIEYSFAHPPYWHWYIELLETLPAGTSISGVAGRPDPSIHFRHRGFTNVCWTDGHVTKEAMDLSASYITHAVMTEEESANMSLGWFGSDDNNLFNLK